jgi:alpha-L-rhamnosidase
MPHPGGGFTEAAASLETHYGKLSAAWSTGQGKFIMDLEIPANTHAAVFIPSKDASHITEQGKPISGEGMAVTGSDKGYTTINLGSGKYHFEVSQ